MDSFRTIVRRLIFGLLVSFAASSVSVAQQTDCPAYDAAMATCQNALGSMIPADKPGKCVYVANYGGSHAIVLYQVSGAVYAAYQFTPCSGWTPPVGTPCSGAPNEDVWRQGIYLNGYQTDLQMLDPSNGATVSCRMSMSPVTPPLSDGHGNFWTLVRVEPVGSGAPDASPVAAGSVVNGSGQTPSSAPPNLPASASSVAASSAPDICGQVSCVNPNTGQVCFAVNGVQTCEPMPTLSTVGGCASASTSTLCAGVPSAPSPSSTQVPDPPSSINGVDSYTGADPGTGSLFNVGVSSYTVGGGASATNGAGSGAISTGPASSSSSGASGSFSGGGDCDTPPVCSGDAAMCGTALEEWRAMCTAHTDEQNLSTALVGNGQQPPTFASDQSKYGQSDVWVQPTLGNTQGDQANAGSYNQTGFGYARQCPLQDFAFTSIPFVARLSLGCGVIDAVGYIILGFALFTAYMITKGSNR
jgi:hypothetical protein